MRNQNHSGSVRGVDFNPFQPNLLASAAGNGEVMLFPVILGAIHWFLMALYPPPPSSLPPLLFFFFLLCHHLPLIPSLSTQIFIWDLTNPTKPYSPGARSPKLEDITAVAWNQQVQHILSTCSTTGYTVVWDLRNRREVMFLQYPGAGAGVAQGRRGITDVKWNPDVVSFFFFYKKIRKGKGGGIEA